MRGLPRELVAATLVGVGVLVQLGLRSAAVEAARAEPRARLRLPVVRSGTALEVAETSWLATGVSRELALSIPAVAACRNLIVGTVVQLVLYRYRGGERLAPDYLLSKPDPSTTLPATLGGTVDDLLFYGRSYWLVLDRDAEGYVRRARWTPQADVTPQTSSDGGTYATLTGYTVAGVRGTVRVEDLIRFDSPIPGVLTYGGATLLAALDQEDAARRFAAVELPTGVLTNESGHALSDDELSAAGDSFAEARRKNGVAVLDGWKYERADLNPADLQLLESRAATATDIARLFNVPVTMIGASPSGGASALLYSNLSQQLAVYSATAVAPHLRTIESTLSDVIPRGQSVAFDTGTFLRSDPQAAADYAIALVGASIITTDEARGMLAIPPSSSSPDLTPGRV